MKIDEKTRFPYPVLSELTGDYTTGRFIFSTEMSEAASGTGECHLKYARTVDESVLQELLLENKASIGVLVTCLDTFFSDLMPAEQQSGTIAFPAGILYGRVSIRPVLFSRDALKTYQNDNLHEEYGGSFPGFLKGAILAIGEEETYNVGREKLAAMESIFTLVPDEGVPAGEVRVSTEEHKIQIHAATPTLDRVHKLRNTQEGKAILLNSIYLPAVMEVLSDLRTQDDLQSRNWFRVFSAKCDELGVDLKNGSLLDNAQKLLKSPFARIKLEEGD